MSNKVMINKNNLLDSLCEIDTKLTNFELELLSVKTADKVNLQLLTNIDNLRRQNLNNLLHVNHYEEDPSKAMKLNIKNK